MARKGLSFGEFFKQQRVMRGTTLRDFCLENGFDPGNISKLERGHLRAPQNQDKLEEYAKALGLKRNSEEWVQFFDLAAADSGTMPQDLMADKNVVERLPAFFRTLRNKKLTAEKLDALIERLKQS